MYQMITTVASVTYAHTSKAWRGKIACSQARVQRPQVRRSIGRSTLTSFLFHLALVVRSRLAVAAAAAAPPLTVRRRMLPAPRAGSGSSSRGCRRGDASSRAAATLC